LCKTGCRHHHHMRHARVNVAFSWTVTRHLSRACHLAVCRLIFTTPPPFLNLFLMWIFYWNVFCFCSENLIDNVIESAVSQMQTVVELGRVVRDRRTLPMKVWFVHISNLLVVTTIKQAQVDINVDGMLPHGCSILKWLDMTLHIFRYKTFKKYLFFHLCILLFIVQYTIVMIWRASEGQYKQAFN